MGALPIIVGIDPSLVATGVSVLDLCDAAPIQTAQTSTIASDAGGQDIDSRLDRIDGIVSALPMPEGIGLAVVEGMFATKSAGIVERAGLWWSIVRAYREIAAVPVLIVPPASLKRYATGRGSATKADMRVEILKRHGIDIRDDNQVDALWLSIIGARMWGAPVDKPPASHLTALEKLRLSQTEPVYADPPF